jgi:hypothetical protein
MKFRHLEYFIAAAEESNFTHAADRLSLLKEEPFISLNLMYPNYGDWLWKVCRRAARWPL